MGVIEFLLALAQDMILAAIPAVGFAMVFNVPVRALRWCALLGAIGHGSRMILMTSGLNIEILSGLKAGDRLITEGQAQVHDGSKIKIVK